MSIVKPLQQEPQFLQPLLSFCHRRRYPAKTDIVHPGDNADTLFYLVDGSVAIIIEDEEGKEIILTYLNKGEFIGEMGLFTSHIQPSRSVLVRTRSSCMLAEISYARLEQLFETDLK
ncbi:MAG TPA: cyclic nucleotide-binding domain-containing protein, partial [Gammaproteobacteria bacterium]|nr:cyclic nucleotide-binding domain-containing protein [Gammaproteobacteria bacterium]